MQRKKKRGREPEPFFKALLNFLCTSEGLWFLIIKPQKKSRIKTCGPYSDGENFTLIMDERPSRAKQVQIKFGKFIVIFQKTSQVLQGGIPILSPPHHHMFPFASIVTLRFWQFCPGFTRIGKRAHKEQTLGLSLWTSIPKEVHILKSAIAGICLLY